MKSDGAAGGVAHAESNLQSEPCVCACRLLLTSSRGCIQVSIFEDIVLYKRAARPWSNSHFSAGHQAHKGRWVGGGDLQQKHCLLAYPERESLVSLHYPYLHVHACGSMPCVNVVLCTAAVRQAQHICVTAQTLSKCVKTLQQTAYTTPG